MKIIQGKLIRDYFYRKTEYILYLFIIKNIIYQKLFLRKFTQIVSYMNKNFLKKLLLLEEKNVNQYCGNLCNKFLFIVAIYFYI